ncbi:2,3-diaminopropionate biosynthesis protein SbnA [Brachybacterium sp. AOP43-C2-M15]|uniref:2,3-diaminopropionate biosynthesis protein SbnA n=1 Tax=Brachybacterium sp. AOP43-C2-M15 TaxID=3457661 RepID=UPI00403430D3
MSTTSAGRTVPAAPGNAPAGASELQVLHGISAAVGRTPLIRLERLFPHSGVEILAKLESVNPGGSTKDRPALAMVRAAIAEGRLTAGGTVVESSSGNLGVALARVCTEHGVRFVCVVDSRTNPTTVATIRALGGEIEMVTEPDPATGDLLTARLHRVEQLLERLPDAINLYQYGNPANPDAHRTGTMQEIAEATGGRLDVLMAAVSTTGTLSGCTAYLREHAMETRTVAVDSVGSVLFGGTAAPRPLPGIGAGVVTEISRSVTPDRVMRVDALDAVAGARLLARREGILAGASTGAIIHALGTLVTELEVGTRLALIVHDGGVPYLGTVYDDDWVAQTLGAGTAELEAAGDALLARARRA